MPFAFLNNEFVPLENAKISIMTHALHYGTACFEGIRGNYNSEQDRIYLFRMRDHYQRLHMSCHILKIGLPYNVEYLCDTTGKLVEMNSYKEDIYIRPVAYKKSEVVGVRLHNLEDGFFVFSVPFGDYLDVNKGIRCCTSTWRRIEDTMIPPRAKVCGLYVNSALAKTEAWENGYDEGIMLTNSGHVSEGSGENIFMVVNNRLITPPSYDGILMGITRDTVITLAKNELGIETSERPILKSELYQADECFLTGTAAHISSVVEIDKRKIGDGEVGKLTQKLQHLYFDIIRGKNAKYIGWCTAVSSKKTKVKAR